MRSYPTPACLLRADELVAAVAAHGMNKGCKLLGISRRAVDLQRSKNPTFAARVDAATQEAGLHCFALPESAWEETLELLKTHSTALSRAGLPASSAIAHRCRRDAAFAARYREVIASRKFEQVRRVGRKTGQQALRRASEMKLVVWIEFLEHLATRKIRDVSALPGMPGAVAFHNQRKRDPAFDEAAAAVIASRNVGFAHVTPARIDALLSAVREVGLNRACQRPDTPSIWWVTDTRVKDPVFAARLNEARDFHAGEIRQRYEQARAEQAAAKKRAAEERKAKAAKRVRDRAPIGEVFNRQLRQNDLYRLAAAAASSAARYLQGDARDDLIADLVLGVLNGEYGAEDMKVQARKYQTAYYGALRDATSMDVSRSADDQRTLHDQIGSWDYG